MIKKIFVGTSEGYVKNFEAYLREVFASTGLRPEECKLVQRQAISGNIVEIVAWVEPLGNAEMDAYRQRAEVAEAENARLREAARWIPVSERLPEEKTFILVSAMNRVVYREWYIGDIWFTHWRPLPEPPEVK